MTDVTCPLCKGEGKCGEWVHRISKPPKTELEIRARLDAIAAFCIASVLVFFIAVFPLNAAHDRLNRPPSQQQICMQACPPGKFKLYVSATRERVTDGDDNFKYWREIPERCECADGN